jgi:hypothetical protein
MTMKAVVTPSGSEMIETSAERQWKRNTMQMIATTANCSMSVLPTVATERLMRSERS